MLDLLIDAVMAIGPNRQIFYANISFTSMFELPRKKIFSGIPCYELIMFDDPDLFIMPNGQKGEKRAISYQEVKYETVNGKKGSLLVAILPTKETFQRNSLWFVYFHDFTLEETVLEYRKLLDTRDDLIKQLKSGQGSSELRNEMIESIKDISKSAKGLAQSIQAGNVESSNLVQISSGIVQATDKILRRLA